MNIKKYSYLIIAVLMLLIGIKNVSAEESKKCYYMSDDTSIVLEFTWGFSCARCHTIEAYSHVYIDKEGGQYDGSGENMIINWVDNIWSDTYPTPTNSSVNFTPYNKNTPEANKQTNPSCPNYVVYQHCGTQRVWITEDESKAQKAATDIQNNGCKGFYASNKHENGNQITKNDYYAGFKFEGIIDFNNQGEPNCDDFNEIFGDKNDPDSIRYLINEILSYVRVIVPILVILMGTLDFSKAVIAGKEDNMKKAQNDFIKRVIIGLAVFFVPTLVDLVMELADIVWAGDYSICKL